MNIHFSSSFLMRRLRFADGICGCREGRLHEMLVQPNPGRSLRGANASFVMGGGP